MWRMILSAAPVGLFAVALPSLSCFGDADYRCESDAECRWGERRGTCEAATSHCSYPDDACPSSSRYSDQAGELAGRCVDESAGNGSSSSTTTTSAGTTTEAGESSTGTPPLPVCGNGTAEQSELCDDGNEIDGDGCNVDCVPSGSPRWDPAERVHRVDGAANALFWDVDALSDGNIILVGLAELFAQQDALLVLLTEDGDNVWTNPHDSAMGDDIALAVTSAQGTEIFVAGRSPNPTALAAWLAKVDPTNGELELVWTGQTFAPEVAHVPPTRLVVAGYSGALVGGRLFTDDLAPIGQAEATIEGAAIAAIAVDGSGTRAIAYAAGRSGDAAWVVQLDFEPKAPEPLITLFDGLAGSRVQGLDTRGGALVLGGAIPVPRGSATKRGWVQQLAPPGRRVSVWTWWNDEATHSEVEDVAIDSSGHVIAVGFSQGADQDLRVWKLSAAGELMWTWTWDEPLPNDDIARAVTVRPDDDILVAGARARDDEVNANCDEDPSTLDKPDCINEGWVVRLSP